MPVIYSDNMVLQREKPLRIAGTANAGEKVTVSIAGQKGEAITTSDGKWSVILPPMKAGGPYTLSISAEIRETGLYEYPDRRSMALLRTVEYGISGEQCR